MATRHEDAIQQEESVGLKRKPTGPPRLLLGRTRTRSTKDDEPETTVEKLENSGDDDGHHEAGGETDDIRNGRRCRWWSRLSSAVVCIKAEDGLENPQQGALQEPDDVTQGGCKRSFKEKKRFNLRMMMMKKCTTSSDVRQAHKQRGDEALPGFQKRLQEFFMRARPPVLLENMKVEEEEEPQMELLREEGLQVEEEPQVELLREEGLQVELLREEGLQVEEEPQMDEEPQVKEEPQMELKMEVEPQVEEEPQMGEEPQVKEEEPKTQLLREEDLQVEESLGEEEPQMGKEPQFDEPTQLQRHATGGHPETLMVNQLTEDRNGAGSPEQPTETTMMQTICHTTSTSQVLVHLGSTEEDQVFTDPDQLSSHQPPTSRPTILIELCPPDDVAEEGEACCQGSSSLQSSLHLLLSFNHSEQLLRQTARSLVQAAMTAAVDQLSREKQNGCLQGCGDHA